MAMIEITLSGKRALVPAEHKAKILKKQVLVSEALALQNSGGPVAEVQKIVAKIVRLNRQIPACVQFLE